MARHGAGAGKPTTTTSRGWGIRGTLLVATTGRDASSLVTVDCNSNQVTILEASLDTTACTNCGLLDASVNAMTRFAGSVVAPVPSNQPRGTAWPRRSLSMRFVRCLGVRGLAFSLVAFACASCGSVKGAARDEGPDASELDRAAVDASDTDSDGATSASTTDGGMFDSGGDASVAGAGNDHCGAATSILLSGLNPRVDLMASTIGATHDVDAACSTDQAPDVFYKFAVSKRVFVYADTFGASWDTVLFLLSDACVPITTTTPGDAVCSDNSCGTQQSRVVALLEPGSYRLGLTGRGGAQGAATIHFEWALAGSGTAAQLPAVNSVQVGTTVGSAGNIDGLSSECLAAASENSYWWARCPSDPARSITASTCGGGTTWESVIEAQIPKSAPGLPSAYRCNLNGCGLQGLLTTTIPAGAGLGVLSIDGQAGNDIGPYTMTVTYTP